MTYATLLEGATEPGAHLTERDAAAALHELRQKPAEPKPAEPKPQPQDTAPPPSDEPQNPAAPAADTQTQDAPVAPKEDAPKPDETPATLSDLAAKLGTDETNLMGLKLKTKIDGEDGEVTLAQALKSYQLEGHQNRKLMELSEQKKAFEQARDAEVQKITAKRQETEMALNVAAQMLYGEYARTDWAKLQAEDPIGYLTTKEQFEQRQRQLQGAFQAIQKDGAERAQKQQDEFKAWAQTQAKELTNHFPEWKSAADAEKHIGRIYAKGKEVYGLTQPELDQLYDNRYIRILNDAVAYRELQGQKPAVLKRVNEAPTLAKPGSGQKSNNTPKQEALARFGADPSERNAAAALSALRTKKK